jgi:hypothetical protein
MLKLHGSYFFIFSSYFIVRTDLERINSVIHRWINYFKLGSIQAKLKKIDEWLRKRLIYCICHDWHRNELEIRIEGSNKPERKRKNLIRLGVEQGQAYAWSRSRMGGWAIAQSPILGTTITLDRLKKRGYESMLDIYRRKSPQLNEPLYTYGAALMNTLL